jgi:DNA-binding CsgD family transcriptional regulator
VLRPDCLRRVGSIEHAPSGRNPRGVGLASRLRFDADVPLHSLPINQVKHNERAVISAYAVSRRYKAELPYLKPKAEGKMKRSTVRPWTSGEEKQLNDLLEAGKTVTEIATELERSRNAVYARVQRLHRNRPMRHVSQHRSPR